MDKEYPSIYKSNRLGHIFQAVTSTILLLFSSWLLLISVGFDGIPQNLVFLILGIVALASLVVLLLSILRLYKPIPKLQYHAHGFDCTIGTSTLIQIKWEEVENLAFVSAKNEEVIAIILKRPASIIRRYRGWASLVMKARLKNYGTPIIFSAKDLNISLDEMKLGFVHYWNKHRHEI